MQNGILMISPYTCYVIVVASAAAAATFPSLEIYPSMIGTGGTFSNDVSSLLRIRWRSKKNDVVRCSFQCIFVLADNDDGTRCFAVEKYASFDN